MNSVPCFLTVGCGSIGKRHIQNLLQLQAGRVIACDPDEERCQEVRERFSIDTFASLGDALEQNPSVVLICTPNRFHLENALQAAEHGCHLFIEKPLSHTLNGVSDLLEILQKKNLISLVGCNMRFHPGLTTVKRLLDENAIGGVTGARVEFGYYLPDWHPQEDYRRGYSAREDLGGGVILDVIHEIDFTRWLLGEVRSVACMMDRLSHLEIETEDSAAILFRFTSGVIGEVHLDYVQRVYNRQCEIIGEQGTIRWDFSQGEVRLYRTETQEWQIITNPQGWTINEMYIEEMRHFLDCLRTENHRTMLDASGAARVLKIALAAKQSAQENRFIFI